MSNGTIQYTWASFYSYVKLPEGRIPTNTCRTTNSVISSARERPVMHELHDTEIYNVGITIINHPCDSIWEWFLPNIYGDSEDGLWHCYTHGPFISYNWSFLWEYTFYEWCDVNTLLISMVFRAISLELINSKTFSTSTMSTCHLSTWYRRV